MEISDIPYRFTVMRVAYELLMRSEPWRMRDGTRLSVGAMTPDDWKLRAQDGEKFGPDDAPPPIWLSLKKGGEMWQLQLNLVGFSGTLPVHDKGNPWAEFIKSLSVIDTAFE